MSATPEPDQRPLPAVSLQAVTAENWRATLALGVPPAQQRFVADHAPIAAIALAKAYVRPGGLVWEPYAICAQGQAVGLVLLAYAPGSADQYWIYHFFIDQHAQGRGYGRAALRALETLVRSHHPACERIQLQVHPDNRRAQRLYAHAGFAPTGTTIDGEPVYALAIR
jgi:diamine N-acetyltransferase